MAARASGLHWPAVKNFWVSSFDTSFQTAGHFVSRVGSCDVWRAKSGSIEDTSGKEKANAGEAKKIRLGRRIVVV